MPADAQKSLAKFHRLGLFDDIGGGLDFERRRVVGDQRLHGGVGCLGCLENPLFGDASVRAAIEGLAALLQEIADASGQVSDRLALRHFAHVDDVSQRTVSV